MRAITRIALLLSVVAQRELGVALPEGICLDDYHWDATVGACLLYPPPPPQPPPQPQVNEHAPPRSI